MKPPYAAHTPPAGSDHWQELGEHLEAVARQARP